MLLKNMIRKIRKSLGRYLSIFFIIFVGIGFLSGIQAASSDIRNSLQTYYQDKKLMDIKMQSAKGFTTEDKAKIESIKGISEVVLTQSMDVLDKEGKVIRLHALTTNMNQLNLIKGSMPKTDTQAVADAKKYKIGDQIQIKTNVDGILKNTTFTVVGTVESPLYVKGDYGSSTLGDGTLNSFFFVREENFTLPVSTEMDVLIKKSNSDYFYTSAYTAAVKKMETKIEDINTKENTGWYVTNRNDFSGYKDLQDSTFMIDKVAVVLPVFFILIVILMTSNTMARMILEERAEMGTMLSLGYKHIPITATYLGYVLSATILAGVLGFFAGSRSIPIVIYNTFQKFIMPSLKLSYSYEQLVLFVLIAMILMSAVTIFFCALELRQIPARLLRPIPPKKGKKILAEQIPFLWSHLNFTWKVTIRNMFRYKQRVFMMIVGVAGCSALLLTGFGLKKSINGVTQKQFHEIFQYEAFVTFKNEVSTIENATQENLKEEGIENPLLIRQNQTEVSKSKKSYEAYMVVSSDMSQFYKYYHLTDSTKKSSIRLTNNGAVITKRVADLLQVKTGDTINVKNNKNEIKKVTINAIADNYIGNYIYFSANAYQKVFGTNATYNMFVCNYHTSNEKQLTDKLMKQENVLNITYQKDIIQKAADGFSSLDGVIVLIVVVAVLLSIIVLYNLTSINLSERKREIATLKVLGFTEVEANSYIYREAFFLTLLSIGIGLILGKFMHSFVITTIQGENTTYLSSIDGMSYVWSVLILLAVAFLMQLVTYLKIRTIDMIDSLKSVE